MGHATPPAAQPPELRLLTATPHPALHAHAVQYLQFCCELPAGAALCNRVGAVPGPTVALLWSGEVQVLDVGGRDVAVGRLVLSGPLPRWRDHRYAGAVRAFFVQLTATGAALLDAACAGLADSAPALTDVAGAGLGPRVHSWADEVMHARDFAERTAATDRFLLARLARLRRPAPDVAAAAAAHIARAHGCCRISALGAELGVSERTLRRRFYQQAGLSLKRFARIVRFRQAHALLTRTPGATWADAVARLGYVDQAHLIHEFQEFAGQPPSRLDPAARALDSVLQT